MIYENLSDRFYIKEKNYGRQYAPIYAERLTQMRDEIKTHALKKWHNYKVESLADIEPNRKCIIIGTLYKEMEQKPNILKELSEETISIVPQPIKERYIDDEDSLILEDEVQRIVLVGKINKNEMCTGFVIALLGFENDKSQFEVEDYCFKQAIAPKKIENPLKGHDKYLVFVSGLELGTKSDHLLKIQLFLDLISGDFMNDESDDHDESLKNMILNVERLIIAGNSLDSTTQSKDMHNKAKYLTKNYVAGSVQSMKQLDDIISQVANKLDVDIMPGEYDPSNYMMPQQPLHPAMFTKSKQYKAFHTASNPYEFELDGIRILGTSGQPVDDIRRYTSNDDPIEIMKLCLEAGHIAPTCPDTLACYPYYGKDPFIIQNLPHVYFCANQKEYKHEIHKISNYNSSTQTNLIHLITIPRFKSTSKCVFLNLRTLESEEFSF